MVLDKGIMLGKDNNYKQNNLLLFALEGNRTAPQVLRNNLTVLVESSQLENTLSTSQDSLAHS